MVIQFDSTTNNAAINIPAKLFIFTYPSIRLMSRPILLALKDCTFKVSICGPFTKGNMNSYFYSIEETAFFLTYPPKLTVLEIFNFYQFY
jgi:hypothetical protein